MGKILFPQYFPICPEDGNEYIVPGYTDALTSNIENTMKMFWRPNKIKISGSYMQYDEDARACITPATYELIIQSPYGSEEEMCCEPVEQWTVQFSNNVENSQAAYSWDSKPYKKDPENLFTLNSFDFTLDGGATPGNCSDTVLIKQLYPTEDGGGGPYDYQTINIAGVDFNMATYVDPISGVGYLQPSIEVIGWWSFGGTYDTETGEPL